MVELIKKRTQNVRNELTSGITVALALVPEAVAFSFVAGVDPLVGLYAAFMVGLITSIFGGRPGMISGATGALAVVMVSLVQEGNAMGLAMAEPVADMGLQYLFVTVICMGMIQALAGVLELGKFIRLVPHPVMLGFVNGLAIVIFLSQLGMFKTMDQGISHWLQGPQLLTMGGLVLATMAIMVLLPRITGKIPAALTAILAVTALSLCLELDVATVGSFIRDGGGEGLKGGLPQLQSQLFTMIPWNLETFSFILPYAFILAGIGIIESLLTLNLLDEITETRGNSNRECVAQGTANIVTALFGGMGGCAMIGQSIINVNSGGRGRLSGIVAALSLLCFILFGSAYIEMVPIAALTGVMFMVVISTFAWSSFRIIPKIPRADALVLISVSALTVVYDLAIAVFIGIIMSALVFSWENALRIRARKRFKDDGTKVYEIWGPLFFGSTQMFVSKFDVKGDPNAVEIDFIESRVSDYSGIEAISSVVEKYEKIGKKVTLKHLSTDCKKLLNKSDKKYRTIIVEKIDDPRYHVVADPNSFN
ncbi:SulP family inorganic anion transporter [Desulfogranum mediterraneum]|uniref:SulP family inorganic anion transporter n=1 Tax=Desulfogranum mediterraneum TaxID=160661 RepID=UPI00041E35C4|nr:SulP family inorganic anion transporter [Desulfogranum mediterraneum]